MSEKRRVSSFISEGVDERTRKISALPPALMIDLAVSYSQFEPVKTGIRNFGDDNGECVHTVFGRSALIFTLGKDKFSAVSVGKISDNGAL